MSTYFRQDQLYVVTIDSSLLASDGMSLGADYTFSFVSEMSLLTGNPINIFNLVQGYFSQVSMSDIYAQIAIALNALGNAMDPDLLAEILAEGSTHPQYANIVCYVNNGSTAELLDIGYVGSMGQGITLGDLTVREPNYLKSVSPIIDRFRRDADMCMMSLGYNNPFTYAVRGGSNNLPPGLGAARTWDHVGYPSGTRKSPQRWYPRSRRERKNI